MKTASSLLYFLILSLPSLQAAEMPNAIAVNTLKNTKNCLKTSFKTEILEIILTAETIQEVFQLENVPGNQIKILENKHIALDDTISVNDGNVAIVTKDYKFNDALHIGFSNVDCSKDALSFVVNSKKDNTLILGGLKKIGDYWELKVIGKG